MRPNPQETADLLKFTEEILVGLLSSGGQMFVLLPCVDSLQGI